MQEPANGRAPAMTRADWLLASALLAVTVAYLMSLPRTLGLSDESNFLYAAKRLAEGDVMYRDVFDHITPLSMYLTALSFGVFGPSMAVARATIAVVHGVIVVGTFACCRVVGVGRSLAVATGGAHLALGHPIWPVVSQHWFASAASSLVLLSLLWPAWRARPRWLLLTGVLTGILVGIQQQKGVPIAAAVGVLILAGLAAPGDGRPLRRLAIQTGWFALGLAVAVLPLFAFLIAQAGVAPLVHALITFPLVNYRQTYRSAWGNVSAVHARLSYPILLKLSPLALVPGLLRLGAAMVRRRGLAPVDQLLTLLVFAAASIVSIAYYPDAIHIAFIAPVLLVVAAEAVDWAVRAALGGRVAVLTGYAIAAALIVATSTRLVANYRTTWGAAATPYETAFGRMDFTDPGLIPPIVRARELLAQTGQQEMFAYGFAAPYLWMGARNPTRYQYFSSRYNDPQQTEEIIATLEARRTPLVMMIPLGGRGDPIPRYVREHYDFADPGSVPRIFTFTRKPETPAP